MAPEKQKSKLPIAEDFEAIQARIAVALAERERLVKSWTDRSTAPKPPAKTKQELEAELTEIYGTQDAISSSNGLQLSASGKRQDIGSNNKLRKIISGRGTGHHASKPRDQGDQGAASKRARKDESSDEEEGRSMLGKGKKAKTNSGASVQRASAVHPAALGEVHHDERNVQKGASHMSRGGISGLQRVLKDATTMRATISPTAATDASTSIYDIPDGEDVHGSLPTRSISKLGGPSVKSGKAASTLPESDESEMEVEIPTALPSINQPSSPIAESAAGSPFKSKSSAKKEKKRREKARRKERDRQLKAELAASGAMDTSA